MPSGNRVNHDYLIESDPDLADTNDAQTIEGQTRQGGSTWQSFQRGKPLESPWIEGAMAELADTAGVAAPVNRRLGNAARQPRPYLAKEILLSESTG